MMVLLQDLVLAFVINSTATILNGGFVDTWTYLVGMFEAFSINYIAGLIIPVAKIGTGMVAVFSNGQPSFLSNFHQVEISSAFLFKRNNPGF